MARTIKNTVVKRFATVGLALIGAQIAFIFFFKPEPSLPINQKIEQVVESKSDLNQRQKAMRKIQLALTDYRANDPDRKYPEKLEQLVPKYFDTLPLNPDNSKPFDYKLVNNKYTLGSEEMIKLASLDSSGSGGVTQAEQQALIDSLDGLQTAFVYDPTGQRDPFKPFNFAPKPNDLAGKTPLERYGIGELKLTSVLLGFDEPRAMVENSLGKGFTVKKGMKIGTNGGEVVDIKADRLLILETTIDFTGEKKTKTLEMKLRTASQENRDQ